MKVRSEKKLVLSFVLASALIALAVEASPSPHTNGNPGGTPQKLLPAEATCISKLEKIGPYGDIFEKKTKLWVERQNRRTFHYLSQEPERANYRSRLQDLVNFEAISDIRVEGQKYYFLKRTPGRNQADLYRADDLKQTHELVLDVSKLSLNGTKAVNTWAISPDGTKLAFGVQQNGSDRREWFTKDLTTNKILPEQIRMIKTGTVTWAQDSSGFFYGRTRQIKSREDTIDTTMREPVFFHALGTKQKADALVYDDAKAENFFPQVNLAGDFLYVEYGGHLLFRKASEAKSHFQVKDWSFRIIGQKGNTFILTKEAADGVHVLSFDGTDPLSSPKEIFAVGKNVIVQDIKVLPDVIAITSLNDVATQLKIYSHSGKYLGKAPVPEFSSLGGVVESREKDKFLYTVRGFLNPETIYELDLASWSTKVVSQARRAFNPEDFTASQVFYSSKDGTRVPMYLIHKKTRIPDGNSPVLLYGYGGFGSSVLPNYSPLYINFMEELNGVVAIPALRGGGEYGDNWHKGGIQQNKQNVFDDFIASAEWLIKNKWTKAGAITSSGASNGGLLVGATVLQRPDLFGAALPEVGVQDMVRFNKFTYGPGWMYDYGDPDDKDDAAYMRAYSPVHNVRTILRYPAILVLTGDHDDRVIPFHSIEFTERLRTAQGLNAPIYLRTMRDGGHGQGNSLTKELDEQADKLTFIKRAILP